MSDQPRAPLPLRRKLLYSLVPAMTLLLLGEVILRLVGYQSAVADPYESFVFHRPLFEAAGDEMRTNPARTYFHPQRFRRVKSPGVQRYFLFGGSDTYGVLLPDPRHDCYGAELARRLDARFTPTHFEVINCGGVAYASYRLLEIVEECLAYEPDLMVVMSGHNEFLEPRHYARLLKPQSSVSRAWNDSRLVRLSHDLGHRLWPPPQAKRKPPAALSADFIDDRYVVRDANEVRQTLEHYVWNLTRMADRCRERGTPLIFCTSPANLRDFFPCHTDPGGGLTTSDLDRRLAEINRCTEQKQHEKALSLSRDVLARLPNAAAFHYTAAKSLDALGRKDEAKREYLLARDTDAFPHRAPSDFNEAMRTLARERAGRGDDVTLFDAEAAFTRAAADGIPGSDLFLDHCHPNQKGHRLLAQGLEEIIAARLNGGK